ADSAGARDRVEFQRLASEQLLRAGYLDQGLAVLERLARELGIWLAPRRRQQLLSLFAHRALGKLSPILRRRRSAAVRDDRRLLILELYWSFFVGLVNYDPIRAMDFQARHKVLAARVGDRKQIALSLAAEASTEAATRGRDSSRVRHLIAEARTLCADKPSPD